MWKDNNIFKGKIELSVNAVFKNLISKMTIIGINKRLPLLSGSAICKVFLI